MTGYYVTPSEGMGKWAIGTQSFNCGQFHAHLLHVIYSAYYPSQTGPVLHSTLHQLGRYFPIVLLVCIIPSSSSKLAIFLTYYDTFFFFFWNTYYDI